ncbi:AmmeMemoRadiSam system protein B [Gammaproteobacteria bacterium]|nr:AmmeMemoRadiSam system protein B [Gammaproteobacteria bacterium]
MSHNKTSTNIRPPALAGTFYPSDPKELSAAVEYFLDKADKIFGSAINVPKAIIVPHAGYIYSGLTAAAAYNRLHLGREVIKRVIILGPCHRVAINGLALPNTETFQTPLGNIHLDKDAMKSITDLEYVKIFNETHAEDHSIEVHLPFLQKILTEFKLLPLIVGDTEPEKVAKVLEILWGGPETLIIISSDLSHYLNYNEAKILDGQTSKAIEQMDLHALRHDQACGRHSIKGLLMLAKSKSLSVTTADTRNSGDTAGSKDRVVGYGSWYFDETNSINSRNINDDNFLTNYIMTEHGNALIRFAASSILSALIPSSKAAHSTLIQHNPVLNKPGASFITLNKLGQLRGCIGSIQAWQPLIKDIEGNARKAAFEDPRFPQITLTEIESGKIEISVSILSLQTPIHFCNEADLIDQLRPGIDGVVLKDGARHNAVFLPSVWKQLPDPKQFLNRLKYKAGLPENYWSNTLRTWRYTTESKSSTALPIDQSLWPIRNYQSK